MHMRDILYDFLVNRHAGIRERYHKFHDGSYGIRKIVSWVYLFFLNFCFYILFCRFLGKTIGIAAYEEKKLPAAMSESKITVESHGSVEEYINSLKNYDVVSFDIFDTLILRPFSEPTDVFFFVGDALEYMNFKQIRMQMELEVRKKCRVENGHSEVTLEDIWWQMEQETGIPAEKGMQTEMNMEFRFCYANPFMLEVFQGVKDLGKKIIITSDMYLSEEFLKKLLEKNGFTGISKFFVSSEYGKNKASGSLYRQIKETFNEKARIVHVGDNVHSDVRMAEKWGIKAVYYPNVNKNTLLYRPYDMSVVIGGAYRGIINNVLHNGKHTYDIEYEYGFIYGGLFVLGYCGFIHDYCKQNGMDKILFLSRDGDIISQVYNRIYPDECTEYVYWSRSASTKLMAEYDKYDYFRRFIFHKVNKNKIVREVLLSMELETLIHLLPNELPETAYLNEQNAVLLKEFLNEYWTEVLECYENQQTAAKSYYMEVLKDCRKVCAVDVGWAGSGAVSLDYLVRNKWKIPCEIYGLIAGTNTIHNYEKDASETFLKKGKLTAYLYSQSHNRDLLKKHDPNRGYNVFWEMLLSSPTRQFLGFGMDENGRVKMKFGEYDANQEGILRIQKGILDFVEEYHKHFKDFSYMFQISGRDAYAPMLVAASHEESYLKRIEKRFHLKTEVD